MSAKNVVAKLRDLSAQPQNRAAIVQDQGCLPGLILFLDSTDRPVVVLALEAIQYLSLCESNKQIMSREMGLLVSINVLIKTGSPEERALATQIKQNLETPAAAARTAAPAPAPVQKQPAVTKAPSPVRQPLGATNRQTSAGAAAAGTLHAGGGFVSKQSFGGFAPMPQQMPIPQAQNSFFVGVANKKAKTFVIQLSGLKDDSTRTLVEEALLSVRGVISFTFELNAGRVSVRARNELSVETIFYAILNVDEDLSPRQVLKNLQGEEVFLEPTFAKADRDDENEPQYLEDIDDEMDPEAIKRSALARKAKPKKTADYDSTEASTGGWLDSVTSFAKSWWS